MPNVAQSNLSPLVIDNEDGTCTPIVATADTVTVTAEQGYDVAGFHEGEIDPAEFLLRFVVARAFVLPEDLTDSQAQAGTAADDTAVFSITLNGVEVGTCAFAPAGDTGTFAAASEIICSVGDVIAVIGPDPADADLADVSVTLSGLLA